MNAVMRCWYGDMLVHSRQFVEDMPRYANEIRRRPRVQFFRFRSGRPGGMWGLKRSMGHRAFGLNFYGGLGRLGFSFGIWPVWAIRFEGYLFPPKPRSFGEPDD